MVAYCKEIDFQVGILNQIVLVDIYTPQTDT